MFIEYSFMKIVKLKKYMSKSCISEAYKYIYSQNSFLELHVDWTV